MELERRSLQIGAAVIACAVALRLLGGGVLGAVAQTFGQPEVASFLLYMETGRVVRPAEPAEPAPPETQATEPADSTLPPGTSPPTEPAETQPPTVPPQTQPVTEKAVFSEADGALVNVRNECGAALDVEGWLTKALDWNLADGEPAVLIVHTHTSESYTKTEDYTETGSYRTLDESYNMISIGDRIAEVLEAGGIRVVHDRTLHDYPSYNGSYADSRESMVALMKEYPTIRMVLDIHRDAMEDSSGNQIATTAKVNGQDAAQVMLVMGANCPAWRENMALAVKLQAQLEKMQPGVCRPICLRAAKFNQDLTTGALLAEIGAAGNTRPQALLAAEALAEAILALSHGAGG